MFRGFRIIFFTCSLSLAIAVMGGVTTVADADTMKPDAWHELKDKHFFVYYQSKEDHELAKLVLRRAEEYYQKIGTQLGYTRYGNFWTWEERAKILMFHDQKSFVEATGQPLWTTGYADRDLYVLRSRVIVTFKQEKEFLDGLLPHEISHLILHDFIPRERIPMWFDEGVAQLPEPAKKDVADHIARTLVKKGAYIPFEILASLDIRRERDTGMVQAFYAQSLSVVQFLLEKYGSDSFARLCRYLKDGKSFEAALSAAYPNTMSSMKDLEQKWLKYMKQK